MSKKTRWVEITATVYEPYHALFEVPNSVSNEDVYSYVRARSETSRHPFEFFPEFSSSNQWHVEGAITVEDGSGFPPLSTKLPQKISVEEIKEFKDG